jgi:hypothetical protein
VTPDPKLEPRAERRKRHPSTRIDYAASAHQASLLRAQGIEPTGPGAEAALCHARRVTARKTRRKTARAARRRNR